MEGDEDTGSGEVTTVPQETIADRMNQGGTSFLLAIGDRLVSFPKGERLPYTCTKVQFQAADAQYHRVSKVLEKF